MRDQRFARFMALFAEVHRDDDKRKSPFSADEFIPDYGTVQEDDEEPWEPILRQVEMMNALMGGEDLRDQEEDSTDG